jgi:hypothetical protein
VGKELEKPRYILGLIYWTERVLTEDKLPAVHPKQFLLAGGKLCVRIVDGPDVFFNKVPQIRHRLERDPSHVRDESVNGWRKTWRCCIGDDGGGLTENNIIL